MDVAEPQRPEEIPNSDPLDKELLANVDQANLVFPEEFAQPLGDTTETVEPAVEPTKKVNTKQESEGFQMPLVTDSGLPDSGVANVARELNNYYHKFYLSFDELHRITTNGFKAYINLADNNNAAEDGFSGADPDGLGLGAGAPGFGPLPPGFPPLPPGFPFPPGFFPINSIEAPVLPIKANADEYNFSKVLGKSPVEQFTSINFNELAPGTIIDEQFNYWPQLIFNPDNAGNGPDVATIYNTSDSNSLDSNLNFAWTKGNLVNTDVGNVLIIPANNIDSNNDGLIDYIETQKSNPAGTITFSFDSPIFQFGFDIFNLEYGPALDSSKIVFTDYNQQTATLPLSSFTNSQSAFYDPSVLFGSHSANRIQPINLEELGLSAVKTVEMTFAEGVGVANINFASDVFEFSPSVYEGNLLVNDDHVNMSTSVTKINKVFASAQEAQDFIQANPQPNISQSGNEVTINVPTNPVVFADGGKLLVQPDGMFVYEAPPYEPGNTVENLSYTIADLNGNIDTAPLTLNFLDNIPVANNNQSWVNNGDMFKKYNLVFMIDVSGSMNAPVFDSTRLEMAQNALISLIEKYDFLAEDINITIIPFASGNANEGSFAYQATDVADAKNFINSLAIQMINPDTNQPLDRGTHYDSALYHARTTLEADLVDANLADYAPVVYFISDGRPASGHSATDNANWPDDWGSWQDFINQPDQLPGVTAPKIESYAIGIDPAESLYEPLEPVANYPNNVIEPEADLSNFTKKLFATLPAYVTGAALTNDLFADQSGYVNKVSIQVTDPVSWLNDPKNSSVNAAVLADGTTIEIILPADGSDIGFSTDIDGQFWINSAGHFTYVPPHVAAENVDVVNYTLVDQNNGLTDSADIKINVQPDEIKVTKLYGNNEPNIIDTTGMSDIVVLQAHRGTDTFVIDMANTDLDVIVIKDLQSVHKNNLQFINTSDTNFDGVLDFNDVFFDVKQDKVNGNVLATLNNGDFFNNIEGTHLIFENIGTLAAANPFELYNHLQDLTNDIDISGII